MSSYLVDYPVLPDSERVFLNGQLQTPDTDDYVMGGQQITPSRPVVDIHADYLYDGQIVKDFRPFVSGILANEAADGVIVVFTFGSSPGVLLFEVYVNGQHMLRGTDYDYTGGDAAAITFVAPPPIDAIILGRYIVSGYEWAVEAMRFIETEEHAIVVTDTDVIFATPSVTDANTGTIYYPTMCECYINGVRNDVYTRLYDGSGNWNGLQFEAFLHPATAYLILYYRY